MLHINYPNCQKYYWGLHNHTAQCILACILCYTAFYLVYLTTEITFLGKVGVKNIHIHLPLLANCLA